MLTGLGPGGEPTREGEEIEVKLRSGWTPPTAPQLRWCRGGLEARAAPRSWLGS